MRQIEHGADRLHRLLRRHAQALEPDVDLDEEITRAARRLRVGPGRVEIDEGGNQIVGQRLGRGARQEFGYTRIGVEIPCCRSLMPSLRSATASQSAPFRANAV